MLLLLLRANARIALGLLLVTLALASDAAAQVRGEAAIHRRGRLWEQVWNNGVIGDLGAWDYGTSAPLGMFPAFDDYSHPVGGEGNAWGGVFSNANFHNFRSGFWIVAKDVTVPDVPPQNAPRAQPYGLFYAGLQSGVASAELVREPIRFVQNYGDSAGFDPLLPEELAVARWNTNLGVTVTRRSYVWSYPGYNDFIIYDYVFENTGEIVSDFSGQVVPNKEQFRQTLNEVFFSFHSGISVSTKSQINFHDELTAVQAGAFGWLQPSYHDFYHVYDDGALAFSTHYNGGSGPTPWNPYRVKENELWKRHFGDELQSPAAFGWLTLFASPRGAAPRTSAAPDVFRVDTHKGGTFAGQSIDLERFSPPGWTEQSFHRFSSTPSPVEPPGSGSNNGQRMNFYTHSYGPYTLAPGDSVRFVIAEIAGVMDYADVVAGDPEGHFPDSTIAAIRRNAEFARQAVEWGMGATVDGMPLAADAPEPPPAPLTNAVNASQGTSEAAIAVTWDQVAETATITDGSGGTFYDGLNDLDGYRIYRTQDFQYDPAGGPPVLRGAYWTLLADIPKAEFAQYFDEELGLYSFVDSTVAFGERYGYYVGAYNADPGSWTSANETVVTNLPTLENGSHRRTQPSAAFAGPVETMDVYAVPNPFVLGEAGRTFGGSATHKIEFRNLPESATIRIYTVSGDLVKVIEHGPDEFGNRSGTAEWVDQRTDSGLLVSPGLYIFHVESTAEGVSGAKTGKLMIIR